LSPQELVTQPVGLQTLIITCFSCSAQPQHRTAQFNPLQ